MEAVHQCPSNTGTIWHLYDLHGLPSASWSPQNRMRHIFLLCSYEKPTRLKSVWSTKPEQTKNFPKLLKKIVHQQTGKRQKSKIVFTFNRPRTGKKKCLKGMSTEKLNRVGLFKRTSGPILSSPKTTPLCPFNGAWPRPFSMAGPDSFNFLGQPAEQDNQALNLLFASTKKWANFASNLILWSRN